jgi:hypothetical protein
LKEHVVTTLSSSRVNWWRVVRAAATLALFYAGFVVIEFFVLAASIGRPPQSLRELLQIAPFFAIPFVGSFGLLAIARRVGFAALWVLLAGFWVFLLRDTSPPALAPAFLIWSILALPLWLMGQLGVARTRTVGKLPVGAQAVGLALWAVLILAARLAVPLEAGELYVVPPGPPTVIVWIIWAPAPFLISAFALRHVWRGTAPDAAISSST